MDDTVSATCTVTKGDTPLKIWWTFQGDYEDFPYNLTTNDGIVISRPSQRMSVLLIESVKARMRGLYQCVSSNVAGTSMQSSYLSINGVCLC